MAITKTGLVVQTYEEALDEIIAEQQENVSSTISASDDTGLGQTTQIFAQRVALLNELALDIYDQRDIYKAEGKALDDNVSWMGIKRQGAAATKGEAYFGGDNGTIIAAGSFLRNAASLERYTVDASVTISKNNARNMTFSVATVLDTTQYTVSIQGVDYDYTSDSDATDLEIIAGLVAAINLPADPDFSATDNLDGTAVVNSLSVGGATPKNLILDVDSNLKIDLISTAGNVTGVNKGALAAPANTITEILSPANGWVSVNNPTTLVIGRAKETDEELRERAVNFRSSTGKATVDAMIGALLNVSGVSSVAINERHVSQFSGDFRVTVDTVVDDTDYDVTINDVVYTFNSGPGATQDSIAQGLVAEINSLNPFPWTAVDDTGTFTGQLSIKTSSLYTISLQVDANMSILEGQPAGSIQVVVSGGDDTNEVAQTIWDTKPAGVEVWALNDGTTEITENVTDINNNTVQVSYNQPESITTVVEIRYKVFDSSAYPAADTTAFDSIKEAIVVFGNKLASGEDVVPSEFEGTVYGAVGGIYDVYIEITANTSPSQTAASDDRDAITQTVITIGSAEDSFFDIATITVINDT